MQGVNEARTQRLESLQMMSMLDLWHSIRMILACKYHSVFSHHIQGCDTVLLVPACYSLASLPIVNHAHLKSVSIYEPAQQLLQSSPYLMYASY